MNDKYGGARGMLNFLMFLGWALVVAGIILAIMGLTRDLPRYAPASARIALAVPGLMVFVSGIFAVAFSFVGNAGVDTAATTQEMLALLRKETGATPTNPLAAITAKRPKLSIASENGKFSVDGRAFDDEQDAKGYVDSMNNNVIGLGADGYFVRGVKHDDHESARAALKDLAGST